MGYPFIQNIFEVLDIAVCILILLTVLELWEFSIFDKFTSFIFISALIASVMKVSPFIIVISAGILGLLRHFIFPKAKPQNPASCSNNENTNNSEGEINNE